MCKYRDLLDRSFPPRLNHIVMVAICELRRKLDSKEMRASGWEVVMFQREEANIYYMVDLKMRGEQVTTQLELLFLI